jgi:hypothetical protein
MMMLVKRK